MTRANATTRGGSVPALPERQKSVLFCPACERAAHTDDWLEVTHPRGIDLYCPDCLGYVTRRR